MKILVLGNSHAAAVKYGWEEIAEDHPEIELDFFALPHDRIKGLKAKGRQLVMSEDSPEGAKHRFALTFPSGAIDVDDYDALFLVGLIQSGNSLIQANFRTRLPHQIGKQARRVWKLGEAEPDIPPGKTIGTQAMFEAAWDSIYRSSVASPLLEEIGKLGGPRCVFARNPLLSAAVLDDGQKLKPHYKAALKNNDAQFFVDMARDRLLRELPDNVTLMNQPAKTIYEGCLTKPKFMTAAKRFYDKGVSFGAKDVFHGNAQFGAALLKKLFVILKKPEPAA